LIKALEQERKGRGEWADLDKYLANRMISVNQDWNGNGGSRLR
jgi:hypothetical protein